MKTDGMRKQADREKQRKRKRDRREGLNFTIKEEEGSEKKVLPTAETPLPTFPPALLVTQCEMESGAGDTVVRSFVSTQFCQKFRRSSQTQAQYARFHSGSTHLHYVSSIFFLFAFSLFTPQTSFSTHLQSQNILWFFFLNCHCTVGYLRRRRCRVTQSLRCGYREQVLAGL